MKIATWNVNSIRVRLPQLLEWLSRESPDVLCLQETKVMDEQFPAEILRTAGYHVTFVGQKAYNGVAILTRVPATEVLPALPGVDEAQKRLLAVTVGDLRVLNVYVPNGESIQSDKYIYKLKWFGALAQHVAQELVRHPRLVLVGDLNVAPHERDVHDPKLWEGQALFSGPERAAFQALIETGMVDVFRCFEQPENSFSWWDYRMNAFLRNRGLRIDHILASPALAACCRACRIDVEPRRLERPSDHTPVLAEFD